MKEYYGGNQVKKGTYLDWGTGEFVQEYGEVRILPGAGTVKYVKVPGILAAAGGPFAGLAFVFFLPLIGIIGAVGFVAWKGWHAVAGMGHKNGQRKAVTVETK